MACPTFEIDDPYFAMYASPADKFAEIKLRGFWDEMILARFATEVRSLVRHLADNGCAAGTQTTLIDLSDHVVQSQQTLLGLAAMAADPSIGSRKIAVLLSSAMVKMQARRVAPTYGLFATRAEALAWLSD